MKTITLILAFLATFAAAAEFDVEIKQKNAAGGFVNRILTPTATSLWGFTSGKLPTVVTEVAPYLGAFTGDATKSAGGTALTLATVNGNVGTWGSATQSAVLIINGKGLVTGASNVTITPAVGSITGLGTGVSGALGTAINTSGGVLTVGGGVYEVPLTFSTGLTRTVNTVTVNTSQNIATLSNLTSNGLVTTSGSTGALSITIPGTGVLVGLATAVNTSGGFLTHGGGIYEVPLTFSTGLTRSTNTITVNTSQNIAKLSNLTSNGFVKTGSGDGTLSVSSTVALATEVSGDLPFANLTQIAGLSVLGVTGGSTADVAAITAASDFNVLRRSGSSVGFGAIDLSQSGAVTGDLALSNIAQGSALSVLGVTGNAGADNASIAAASDHQVLRRSGTAVAFGAVNLASSNAVTGALPIANGGTGQTAALDALDALFAATGTLAAGDIFYYDGSNIARLAMASTAAEYYLRGTASSAPSWQLFPSGLGDVYGPATNTTAYVPTWHGTNDKTLDDGLGTITDSTANLPLAGKLARYDGNGYLQANGFYAHSSITSGLWAANAWVDFDGTSSAAQAATYSRTLTTVTVTLTAHGYITGNVVYCDFTSGGALDGVYTITGITDANNFTLTTAASGTIAAGSTLNLLRRTIRGSSGVHSVTYNNTNGSYYINFTTAFTDANYAATGTCTTVATAGICAPRQPAAPTAQACSVLTLNFAGTATNFTYCSIVITR